MVSKLVPLYCVVFPRVSTARTLVIESALFFTLKAVFRFMCSHPERPNLLIPYRRSTSQERGWMTRKLKASRKAEGGPFEIKRWVKDQLREPQVRGRHKGVRDEIKD